jgi:hypothetical protein
MFVSQTSYLFCSEAETSLPHTLDVTNPASYSEVEKFVTSGSFIYFETGLGWLILFSVMRRSSVVCSTPQHLQTSHAVMTASATESLVWASAALVILGTSSDGW